MHVELPRYPRAPAEVTCKLRQPTQANRSEFTGLRRVTILAQAARWSFQVKYPPIIGEAAFRPWRAALALLQGRAGTFQLPVTENYQPFSWGAGPPVVDGANQIGSSVALRNLGRSSVVRRGWFITIGDALHQVTREAIVGADGKVSLDVMPIVAGYPDGAPVELVRPFALVSMSDDEIGWTVGPGQRYDLSFNCEEAR